MTTPTPFHGFIRLANQGLLLVRGPDAATFLQGQVTCDIKQLNPAENTYHSSLGAHCNHKGRMLFSFRAFHLDSDTIALSMPASLLAHAEAALKKYSIFSKVEIINAQQDYRLIGAIDTDTPGASLPTLIDTPWADKPIGTLVHLDEGQGVAIKISPKRYEYWLTKAGGALLAEQAVSDNSEAWTLASIVEGIGEVRPETIEAFIPQMLNFQGIADAISFKKGCYTGQEVVARMAYLGKLKRHMYRLSCPAEVAITPNMPIYTPDKAQSIGQVVIAAKGEGEKGQQLLAVATADAATADALYLDQHCQQKLQILPLPYAITNE